MLLFTYGPESRDTDPWFICQLLGRWQRWHWQLGGLITWFNGLGTVCSTCQLLGALTALTLTVKRSDHMINDWKKPPWQCFYKALIFVELHNCTNKHTQHKLSLYYIGSHGPEYNNPFHHLIKLIAVCCHTQSSQRTCHWHHINPAFVWAECKWHCYSTLSWRQVISFCNLISWRCMRIRVSFISL